MASGGGRVGFLHAWTTALEYDQPILDANLMSLCGSRAKWCPNIASSKDLSRVGVCYLREGNGPPEVLVWK